MLFVQLLRTLSIRLISPLIYLALVGVMLVFVTQFAIAAPIQQNVPAGLSAHDWNAIQNQLAPQIGYLKADNSREADWFGSSVAISGNTVVVAAEKKDIEEPGSYDNTIRNVGAVYVFIQQNGTWLQQAYLTASNIEESDYFGSAVAISGNTIVVGAKWEDSNGTNPADNSASYAGAAYVFVRDPQTQTWSQQAYLKASNPDQGDWFGNTVAISGDTIVVGAFLEDGNGSNPADNSSLDSGAAYVFVRDPQTQTWSQQAYLKAPNPDQEDWFAHDVAISGDTIVVGASSEDSNGSDPSDNNLVNSGTAYVFVQQNGTWIQQAYLKASNLDIDDYFGDDVAISGDTIVVGASSESGNGSDPSDNSIPSAGAAYVFVRQNGVWSQQAYLKAANAGVDDYFGNNLAISGKTIVIGARAESSNGSSPGDNSAMDAGAAYIFVNHNGSWTQQAYLKAANANQQDWFGHAVAIAGKTIVVGAPGESSNGSSPADNSLSDSGAAYMFVIQPQNPVYLPALFK